ncbi:adaptor protein MecA [Cytobacillus gottheilii]|uniref:adaptor protein MecA n=1 Tax=Cytobacillus gottheilii TaxID=859144 RepID=UPI0009BAA375|nr:adaptor protein MecA [Cytobacillus gottheilii]
MEIERINDHTVKFYISYIDIEERGFDREEIWYNRERSEELFWEMMDEVHREEDFFAEGPLWIQVQALDKGLEVLVTRAQLSKDGQKLELPVHDESEQDRPVDERIEEMLDHHYNSPEETEEDEQHERNLQYLITFKNFEDLISLSKRMDLDSINTTLYSYEDSYFLFLDFDEELFDTADVNNLLSIILEYGYDARVTIHMITEYGKTIIEDDVFVELRKYFK